MKRDAEKPIARACRLAGGQTAMALALQVSVQAVNKWMKKGAPPPERVLAIEKLVSGQVTRYQLRPDIFGKPMRSVAVDTRPAP